MSVANPPAGPGRELVRFPTSPTSYAALDGVSELDYRRRRARATRSAGPVRNPAVLGDGVLGGETATFHPLRQRRPARVMAWVADLSRRPGPSRALDVLSRCLRLAIRDGRLARDPLGVKRPRPRTDCGPDGNIEERETS